MSEPLSDALFGVDGTELPEPLSEPSGRGVSGLPPLSLPVLPGARMTREEVAAVLGEDPTRPADQDPDAASEAGPAQQGAAPPSATHSEVPPVSASPVGASSVPVPPVTTPPVAVTAPLPTPSAPPPMAGAPGHSSRPVAPMMAPLVQPTPGKRSGLRYRPPLAVGSRMSGPLDLRRRVGRRGAGLPPNPRSNGGATLFFLVAFVIAGILTYEIIAGVVESLSRLVP
jgi:hypothetical protein